MVKYTKRTRYGSLHQRALMVDRDIMSLNRRHLSTEEIQGIVQPIFPEAIFIGNGRQKVVFAIPFRKSSAVLKVIKNTARMQHYLRPYIILGETSRKRNLSFLKHYWNTQVCILQKKADPVDPSNEDQMRQVRRLRKRCWMLCDLRLDNLGVINGKVKILDASVKRSWGHQ